MRHRVVGKRLSRDMAHRRALLKNLSESLILHGSVTTTLAKAKYVRPYVERLVTKVKKDTSPNGLRYARRKLLTDKAIRDLLTKVAPTFKERAGGYTRIIRVGNRDGDNALMARIEFVEDTSSKKTSAKKMNSEKKVKSDESK